MELPILRKENILKAHEHKSFWPVTPPVTGGCLPAGRPGVKDLCAILGSARNINHFARVPNREDRSPGLTGQSFMC